VHLHGRDAVVAEDAQVPPLDDLPHTHLQQQEPRLVNDQGLLTSTLWSKLATLYTSWRCKGALGHTAI
jgi:hypothetical protein